MVLLLRLLRRRTRWLRLVEGLRLRMLAVRRELHRNVRGRIGDFAGYELALNVLEVQVQVALLAAALPRVAVLRAPGASVRLMGHLLLLLSAKHVRLSQAGVAFYIRDCDQRMMGPMLLLVERLGRLCLQVWSRTEAVVIGRLLEVLDVGGLACVFPMSGFL
jgi:hypothetical protein